MRLISVLMILAGLLAVYGYPYYHQAFTNFQIGEYTVYDKGNGYSGQSILLAPEDGPININFTAIADTVEVKAGSGSAFLVEINNGGAVLRSETVRFSGPPNDTDAATTSSIEMNVDLEQFPITDSGIYGFRFSDTGSNEIPIKTITMSITGLVMAMDETVPSIGIGLIGLGFLLLVYSIMRSVRRTGNTAKRSKTSQIGRQIDPQPAEPEKPKKQSRKWGRGE